MDVTTLGDPRSPADARPAPTRFARMLREVGPGVIIAGTIVGSGELIATTKVGAQAGVALLWLIVAGCLIKVFVQVELGRDAVARGRTTLEALDTVPGPRLKVGWVVWLWALMMVTTVGQLGGIVAGVGQALALSVPVLGDGQPWSDSGGRDVRLWATLAACVTGVLLWFGRYRVIQNVSAVLVATFTLATVGNTVALLLSKEFALSGGDLLRGMIPGGPVPEGVNPYLTALAAFGIIGVGATELVSYPYWCLEKGYAKFTGPRPSGDHPSALAAWRERASGWLRVMKLDAFAAMGVYTLATVAFYLMGVAVLHRRGLDPDDAHMIATLAESYGPVFGQSARGLFLSGAVAVLYSTFLIANASNARMVADGLRLFGIIEEGPASFDRWVRRLSAGLPLLCLAVFLFVHSNPVTLVLVSGAAQNLLLPALGVSAVYFRMTGRDRGLAPGRWWDVLLILSVVGLLVAGGFGIYKLVV